MPVKAVVERVHPNMITQGKLSVEPPEMEPEEKFVSEARWVNKTTQQR